MNVEKGIILAASEGRRMVPLTDYLPKPLLPLGDKPLIIHSIEQLERWGVKDILITLEPRLGKMIKHSVESGYVGDSNISFHYQKKREGIGFAILECQDIVGDSRFFVVLPDEFHPKTIKLDASDFAESETVLLIRKSSNKGDLLGNINVFIDKNRGKVVKVGKTSKIGRHTSNYHLCGVMVFNSYFFEALKKFENKREYYSKNEFSIHPSIQHMISSGVSVGYIECGGFYVNINTLGDLLRVYRYLHLRERTK